MLSLGSCVDREFISNVLAVFASVDLGVRRNRVVPVKAFERHPVFESKDRATICVELNPTLIIKDWIDLLIDDGRARLFLLLRVRDGARKSGVARPRIRQITSIGTLQILFEVNPLKRCQTGTHPIAMNRIAGRTSNKQHKRGKGTDSASRILLASAAFLGHKSQSRFHGVVLPSAPSGILKSQR